MKKLKILIVEGNLISENKDFKDAGIQTHTESLKESIANYNDNVNYEILNPSSEDNFNKIIVGNCCFYICNFFNRENKFSKSRKKISN